MQNGWLYIKDSCYFLKKIGNVSNIPENVIVVTADVVELYPNIRHNADLKAVDKMLEARECKAVSTEDLMELICFVLGKDYFEFNGYVKNSFFRLMAKKT